MTFSIVKTMEEKVWVTVLFLSAMMHGKVIRVIFAGPRFVEIRKFCFHGNVT